MIKKLLCTKDLYMENGALAFTKGKLYDICSHEVIATKSINSIMTIDLIDNSHVPHIVSRENGGWLQYFKLHVPEKKKLNIYFIETNPYYPVGSAGAVVVASTPKKALSMVENKLQLPKKPNLLGVSNRKKPCVVFINTGDY